MKNYNCDCMPHTGRDALGRFTPHRLLTTLPDDAANPWWDPAGAGLCVWGAWQAKGVADFATSLVDLSGNGNNLVDPGGAGTPGWNAINGWIFDGIANYLTTTFVPQNDGSQSMLIQFSNIPAPAATQICGADNGANRRFAISPYRAGTNVLYMQGGITTIAPGLTAGNFGIGGQQGYRNGVADGAAIGAWAGASVNVVGVGAWIAGGGAATFQNCNVQAFVIYDCSLIAPQMLAVATAMAAL